MIPILYEKTETAFANNGLGRLVDCIECKVTQELGSGVFECDFQYPVTGANFNEIQLGRIIAVTRDDGGQIEPFDIVSYSRPIDGVVSFHAVHTSYRLTKYITSGTNVTSSNLALYMLQSAEPSPIPFTFFAYQTKTAGEMGMADGVPHNVRELIGGGDGSFCSTYNCEASWSRFTVGFTDRIGKHRDFTIRYGVNMMDYNEETDGSECYTMAVPYWKNGEDLVVGNLVDSGLSPFNRPTAVAMDLTSFFKDQPTTAELEAKALEIMLSGKTNIPKRSIEVDFIRLQDLEDYAGYADLLECNLGDSITVVFPMYNITGTFRIVKVIWDALRDRFDTMTLGSLQTTLAEALGVGGGMTNVGGGGGGDTVSYSQVLGSGTKTGTITINGSSTDMYAPTPAKIFYGTCSTGTTTVEKAVTCGAFTAGDLVAGTVIYVDFTYANGASSATLNINSTGAKTVYKYGTEAAGTGSWHAGAIVCFVYDGTYWNIEGWYNTTYEGMTVAEYEAGSSVVDRLISPARLKAAIQYWASVNWTQSLSTGKKIASVTINGTTTDVYAPPQKVWYGICSGSGNQRTATTSSGDFALEAGNVAYIRMDNVLSSSGFAINIDGTGQKGVALSTDGYNEGPVPANFWKASEVVCLVYDGTRFLIPYGETLKASGGGGSYTASAPISISAQNDISHDTSGVTAGTYDGGYVQSSGIYFPSFTVDAKGHITAASDLGTLIPVISTGSSSGNYYVISVNQYESMIRAASTALSGFTLSAGQTTATFAVSDVYSTTPYYMRIVSVEAVDATTGENVIIDWATNYPISTSGKTNYITLTVSIAQAYTHDINIIPLVGGVQASVH